MNELKFVNVYKRLISCYIIDTRSSTPVVELGSSGERNSLRAGGFVNANVCSMMIWTKNNINLKDYRLVGMDWF